MEQSEPDAPDRPQLTPDTFWNEEVKEWTPTRDVDGPVPSPYIPPRTFYDPPRTFVSQYTPSGKQVRPWVRFWARKVDLFLFVSLAVIVVIIVYEPLLEMSDALANVVLLFVYVFFEAAMLAGWGTTPGKALLRVRLRNSDGSKLSYNDALTRAIKVWFRGEGIGIPIVALFTYIRAAQRLTKQGATSWDEEGNFKVSHQNIEVWRVTITVLIFIAFAFLMALGQAEL